MRAPRTSSQCACSLAASAADRTASDSVDTVSTSDTPTVGVTQWVSTGVSRTSQKAAAITSSAIAGPAPAQEREAGAEHGGAGDAGQRGGRAGLLVHALAVAQRAAGEQ